VKPPVLYLTLRSSYENGVVARYIGKNSVELSWTGLTLNVMLKSRTARLLPLHCVNTTLTMEKSSHA
jgi:hypothetical protein